MSSLDFILMEPTEAKGNMSEQNQKLMLHSVQMPIEDNFVDCDEDVDTGCKEMADPTAINNNLSIYEDKDA